MKKILILALLATVSMPAFADDDFTIRTAGNILVRHQVVPEKIEAAPESNEPSLTLYGQAPITAYIPRDLTIRLSDSKNQPLSPEHLAGESGNKVGLYLIDDSLNDFQHVSAHAGNLPGIYTFSFFPHTAHNYRLWAIFSPHGEEEARLGVQLNGLKPCYNPCTDETLVTEIVKNNHKFTLVFENDPVAGKKISGLLFIDSQKGESVKLKPVFGYAASISGFSSQGEYFVQAHTDRYLDGKNIQTPVRFQIEPESAGFMKLFAEVNLNGKKTIVAFGIQVAEHRQNPDSLIANENKD